MILRIVINQNIRYDHRNAKFLGYSNMIICLCRNLSQKDIQKKITDGKKIHEIEVENNSNKCCGACFLDIKKIFNEAKCNSDKNSN